MIGILVNILNVKSYILDKNEGIDKVVFNLFFAYHQETIELKNFGPLFLKYHFYFYDAVKSS